MQWDVFFLPAAKKDLKKFNVEQQTKIIERITTLKENPRQPGAKKLQGDAAKQNLYRIRIGEFRVIYQIQNRKLVVLVVAVADRKSVYQILKKRL